jgi:BNR repeat-like domain
MRRVSPALLSLAVAVTVTIAPLTPAHAASLGDSKPSWWSKYQYLRHHDFATRRAHTADPITVGTNVDVSNEQDPQSETSIAVDPSDPSNLVAGSNEIFRLPMRGYFSSDGGRSWGDVDLPLPPPIRHNGYDFGSDPGVAWDLHGNAYYSYIVVFFGAGFGVVGSEMAVARSSDGGRTWSATYFDMQPNEGTFVDKPMITVDNSPSSPHEGTVYVAFDHTGGNKKAAVFLSRSTNGGRTFSSPTRVSEYLTGKNGEIAADPYVSPNGDVHVAWQDWAHTAVKTSTSTDGGRTWGRNVTIARTQTAFDIDLPSISVRGALLYPSCDADTSSGPFRGRLYCSWWDGTLASDTEVYVSRSTNDGATWSTPVVVNDVQRGDQYYQWLAVDPVTGDVDLSWYDTRLDPSRQSVDVFFAFSNDGAHSFSDNVRVTTAPSNEETGTNINFGNQYGDYEGIDAYGGIAHPVWTDHRASLPDALWEEVFTARIRVS